MSLKETIERDLKIPARIRLGGPGSLDIFADGRKIFSKKKTGRLPSADEVVSLLHNLTKA